MKGNRTLVIIIKERKLLTIRVSAHIRELLAKIRDARLGVSTSRLSIEGLATIAAEPLSKRSECRINIVCHTF